jgi:3-dehydroquinate synthetase
MGLVCACHLGEGLGIFKSGYTKKVLDLMDELGLTYKIPADLKTKDIIKSCAYDKKAENGKLKFIVPKGQIGNVAIVHDIDLQLIGDAINANR